MFHIEKISSFDQPELAPYRTMRRSAEHEAQGIFVAEGEKVVRRLLESRFTVVSVVFSAQHLEEFRPLLEAREETLPGMEKPDAFVGTNVFVLFDTSNFMYKGFVYAEDAIADFVRGLDRADSVAVYTFSRNLSRAATLTRDHGDAIQGLRTSVAGDDTALYNALLLTLRDAAKVPGRKVVIVFSNGPDNASMVAPDDVRAVAEDEGIPIYVISTNEVNKDPISSSVFRRISQRTGGKAYFARTWQKQVEAFEDIREDMSNSYTITYYPAANPNDGFRKISVEIVSDPGKKYRLHVRPGYRPTKSF